MEVQTKTQTASFSPMITGIFLSFHNRGKHEPRNHTRTGKR